jgi:hypothetical protein
MEEYLATYWREDEDWGLHWSFQDSNDVIAGFKKKQAIFLQARSLQEEIGCRPRAMGSIATGNENTPQDSGSRQNF